MNLKDSLYQLARSRLIMDIKVGKVSDIDSIKIKQKKNGIVKYTVEKNGKIFKFTSEDFE